MKRRMAAFIVLTMLLGTTSVYAEDAVTVNTDGATMEFDVEPVLENGRVLVPMRAIFEELGCVVAYSRTDDGVYVTAARGQDRMMLEIGSDTMYLNGSEIKLDVPAKIVDGRTLVPLRAVSEGLGTKVVWLGDIKTVCLYKKHGQHNISTRTSEKAIKSEDGTVLINVLCAYPVIESGGDEYIESINKLYEKSVDEFIKIAESYTEAAREIFEARGERTAPLEFELTYEVNTDRKDILSVTEHRYLDTQGAHPNTERESHTFDLAAKKELNIGDVLNGNSEEIKSLVCDRFEKWFAENWEGELTEEQIRTIKDESDNVKFCLTDTGALLYFDVYQIAPYAMGYPEAEINDAALLKTDMSDGSLDELNIELKGSPSTGYKWRVADADASLEIEESYKEDENADDPDGKEGTFGFKIKGTEEGNCSVTLAYTKEGENPYNGAETCTYKLYVSKDGRITVLSAEK